MRRPYPHYRDSGVEWLGEIPDHWEVGHVGRWFDIVTGGTPASGEHAYWDGEVVWLTPDDLGRSSSKWIDKGRRHITSEGLRSSSAEASPAGSIVLSTRAPIGHLAIAAVPAATNQGCRTLVPHPGTDNRYAYYALLTSRPVLQSLGKGSTFMELTPTDLGGHPTPRPPLEEQRAIAEFLDHETGKIDTLVARKRLLLERLAEYRTALITRTVTRGLPPAAARAAGLDSSPRLKSSGVEWLGEVPDHWNVRPFRRILHEPLKYGANEAAQLDDPNLPRFIRITDIDDGGYLRAETLRSLPFDVAEPYLLERGDLLFARSGTVGRTFLSTSHVVPAPTLGTSFVPACTARRLYQSSSRISPRLIRTRVGYALKPSRQPSRMSMPSDTRECPFPYRRLASSAPSSTSSTPTLNAYTCCVGGLRLSSSGLVSTGRR